MENAVVRLNDSIKSRVLRLVAIAVIIEFAAVQWRRDGGDLAAQDSKPLDANPQRSAGNSSATAALSPDLRIGCCLLPAAFAQATVLASMGDLRGTWASDFRRPMYAQAIATLALSEDYGMTGDPELKIPVEAAIEFIVNAQDHASVVSLKYGTVFASRLIRLQIEGESTKCDGRL